MVRTVSAPLARAQSAFTRACMQPAGALGGDVARLAEAQGALAKVAEATLREAGDFEVAAQADDGDPAFLISMCVDNWVNGDGQTALFVAAMYGREGVCKWLAEECRADLNKADRKGWTPLLAATRFGRAGVVALLCEAGAAVNKASTKDFGDFPAGVTALDAAVAMGHRALAKQLKRHKARRGVRNLQAAIADKADAAAANAEKEAATARVASLHAEELEAEQRIMADLQATANIASGQKDRNKRQNQFERDLTAAEAGGGGDDDDKDKGLALIKQLMGGNDDATKEAAAPAAAADDDEDDDEEGEDGEEEEKDEQAAVDTEEENAALKRQVAELQAQLARATTPKHGDGAKEAAAASN